jgi:uracil-DNA glycosylase
MPTCAIDAPLDCALCPRLVAFRQDNQTKYPSFFNAPVPSFGSDNAALLIVGLAPGLKGANQTGRPFTGDYAGDTLFETMLKTGFASGNYCKVVSDTLHLHNVTITNAVRCVPPQNKPTTDEIITCRPFLINQIELMQSKNLRILLSLGKISHDTVLKTFGLKLSAFPFTHKAVHKLPNGLTLVDSYHCSRYNVNTGRLTEKMFLEVFELIKSLA